MRHASVLAVIGLMALGGCTTVTNPDGTRASVFGMSTEQAQATTAALNQVGTFLPSPFNWILGVVGAGVTAASAAYAAKKKGENDGWDDRSAHQSTIDAAYDAGKTEATAAAPTTKTGA